MSEPREWWLFVSYGEGLVWKFSFEKDAYEFLRLWKKTRNNDDCNVVHVREVDDHDRIFRPEDEDYRLPTKEDADETLVVLHWMKNETEGICFWCEKVWSSVKDNETWRRMPRGLGE